jgi:hypothetical protein
MATANHNRNALHKLSDSKCDKTSKPGRYSDGGNLFLLVKPDGRKTWMFRFRDRVSGKRHDMGLGRYGKHDVTLKDARCQGESWQSTRPAPWISTLDTYAKPILELPCR